jgi:hypothetical protein
MVDFDAEEIILLFENLKESVEPLEEAHKNYANLAEEDVEALDRLACIPAGILRRLAEDSLASAVASGFPPFLLDQLHHHRNNPAAAFAFECREAAESCVAYGVYSPTEAVDKAREAGLVWLATIGARLLEGSKVQAEIDTLLQETRRASREAEEARLERIELEQKADAKNIKRKAKAAERWTEARRIMGGKVEVSPVDFIKGRRPGWQELARLYGEQSGYKMPNSVRAKMLRDWESMKKDARESARRGGASLLA